MSIKRLPGILALLLLLPFVVLFAAAVPWTDDFCFGALIRNAPMDEGVVQFYNTWSGRLSSTVIIMLPSYLWSRVPMDPHLAYRLVIAAQFVVLYLIVWLFFARLLTPKNSALLAAIFIYCAVASVPEARALLYWLPGVATYTLPASLTLLIMLWLFEPALRRTTPTYEPLGQGGGTITGIACLILVPIAATANEFTGLILVVIAAGSLLLRWVTRTSPQTLWHLGILVLSIASVILVAAAPGNEVRLSAFDDSGAPLASIFWGLVYALAFPFQHMLMPSGIAWFALVTGFLLAQSPTKGLPVATAKKAAFVLAAVSFGVLWIALSVGYYGRASDLPQRADNQLHLIIMVGLTMSWAVWLTAHRDQFLQCLEAFKVQFAGRWVARYRTVLISLLLLGSPSLFSAAHALLFEMDDFKAQTRARHEKLVQVPEGEQAFLPALTVEGPLGRNSILFKYDLSSMGPGLGRMTALQSITDCVRWSVGINSARRQ